MTHAVEGRIATPGGDAPGPEQVAAGTPGVRGAHAGDNAATVSLGPAPRRRSRVRLVTVFALLAAALAFLLIEGLGSSLDYFDTVGQALAHKEKIGTSTIRLEGLVVAGSIRRTAAGADFEVSGGGRRVAVRNSGSPPQLFQPHIPVVVVGHFVTAASDVFVSDQIMVKHSATYIASHPTRVRAPNGKVH